MKHFGKLPKGLYQVHSLVMQNRCVLKNLNSSFNYLSGRWGLWKNLACNIYHCNLFSVQNQCCFTVAVQWCIYGQFIESFWGTLPLCPSSSAVGLSGSTALGEVGSPALPLQPILLLALRTAWNAWSGRKVTREKNNLSTAGSIIDITQVPITSF